MILRYVGRCLSYLSLVVIAGLFVTGCVIQEPRAITEIGKARKALDDARKAGKADCVPEKFADLERRFLQVRGVYYPVMMQRPYGKHRLWRQTPTRWAAPPPAMANRPPVCRLTSHRRRRR